MAREFGIIWIMFKEYLNLAMHLAKYELLEGDEGFYGCIEQMPGVYASADILENCRDLLREVLEGWIFLGIAHGREIPNMNGRSIQVARVLERVA